jgi:acetylornithine deacetylase/succinyl-diaminopimelate desuccinylase-like protein
MHDVVALTQHFVSVPSPNLPGDERAMAAAVREFAQSVGLDNVRIVGMTPERPNVLIDVDFGPGGRHLALSGHLDTKPIGDARWSTDPFQAEVIDGNLHGLGTCDMKGALAAMLIATAQSLQDGPSSGRLTLVFTADEEYGSRYGSRFLAEEKLVEADAIVIGEPGGIHQDWDALNVISRGITNIYIDVQGRQGHSSLSQVKGYQFATQAMAEVLLAFASDFAPSFPPNELGSGPTVNAGVLVDGGVGFGVVPGLATFASDVRLVPGMDKAIFEKELTGFLESFQERGIRATARFEEAPRDWLPPTEVSADDPVVASCQRAAAEVLGAPLPLGVFPGTTDAAWLQGMLGTPTLPAFGPGLLEYAHAADERVSVRSLEQSVPIYASLIRDFCESS